MADKEPPWKQMVAEDGLAENSYADVSSWAFADGVFSSDHDLIADGSKARRLGFHDFVEAEAMFRERFDELRRRRVIPQIATGVRERSGVPANEWAIRPDEHRFGRDPAGPGRSSICESTGCPLGER